MRQQFRGTQLLVAGSCLACLLGGTAWGDTTIDDIMSALKRRQERLESCIVKWTQREVHDPGTIFSARFPEAERVLRGDAVKVGLPLKTQTFVLHKRFAIKGRMTRYATPKAFVDPDKSRVRLRDYESAFDGDKTRYWMPDKNHMPRGWIRDEGKNSDTPTLGLQPVMIALRPLSPSLCGVNFENATITQQSEMVNGVECVALVDRWNHLWLDPARDFAMVRILHIYDKQLHSTASLSYEQERDGGWLPKEWITVSYDKIEGEKTTQTFQAEDVSWQIGAPLTKDDFQIQFPIGMTVKSMGVDHVVQPDGTLKPIKSKPIRKGPGPRIH